MSPSEARDGGLGLRSKRAGFPQEFPRVYKLEKWEAQERSNFHRPALLVARESQGLASESFPATCHWDGPAVPGYRRSRGLWTEGSGGWASQDIMFLAPVGGNMFHVFPRVYRAEGMECSLWPRRLAGRGLATRVCPDQRILSRSSARLGAGCGGSVQRGAWPRGVLEPGSQGPGGALCSVIAGCL